MKNDINSLYHSPSAIKTLLDAGIICTKTAEKYRKLVINNLNEAIPYYTEKGFLDVAEGLNKAYKDALNMK